MRRSIKAALAAGIIVAAIAPAATAHFNRQACNGVVTAHSTPAGTVYTDDRGDGNPVPVSVPGVEEYWIYLESNSHPGLQAGGSHVALGSTGDDIGFKDSCVDSHAPGGQKDAILF